MSLSPAAADVVKMAQGVSDDVVLAYIQNSPAPFNLSADNLIYLQDVGLSSVVVTAMINHDKSLPAQNINNQQLYVPANPGQPGLAAPPAGSGPLPAYVGNPPEDVSYFYNDLSPYGTWVNLDQYGWCWQPDGGVHQQPVASLLRFGPLGLLGRGLVLEFGLFLGLGAVPLRPLDPAQSRRLGLVSGSGLGTGVGDLARRRK